MFDFDISKKKLEKISHIDGIKDKTGKVDKLEPFSSSSDKVIPIRKMSPFGKVSKIDSKVGKIQLKWSDR
jgi:hypothetical protein